MQKKKATKKKVTKKKVLTKKRLDEWQENWGRLNDSPLVKCKIFRVTGTYGNGNGYDHDGFGDDIFQQAVSDYTDWEEIDQETYDILRDWIKRKNRKSSDLDYLIMMRPTVVSKTMVIEDYKKIMEAENAKEQKKEETIKKRKATADKKRADKEQQQYQTLREKFDPGM